MQLNAQDILADGPRPYDPDADNASSVPDEGQGLKTALRRAVLLSAAKLAPGLIANLLARRYLTPNQSMLDDLSTRRHNNEIREIGAETAILRPQVPPAPPDAPRVLVIPGHDGHFRQFTRVVRALQRRGAAVDILVFPGHAHATRNICSMRQMVESICKAHAHSRTYDGIVAHCVASNATLQALEHGVSCGRIALISTPLDLSALIRLGGQQYGLSGPCLDKFIARVNAIGAPHTIDTPWLRIAKTRQENLLIVHARNDYASPVETIRPLAHAWPGAQMAEFDQGGHNEILNVTSAINRITEFMVPDPT